MRAKGLLTVISCLLVIAVSTRAMPQASDSCYPDIPNLLDDRVNAATEAILRTGDSRPLGQFILSLISYTIADAVGGAASQNLRSLDRMQYGGDLLRTDKQMGATSTSAGTTQAFELPGLIDLLGVAIEHGAIQQEVNDTSVTLRTSPYMFAALVRGDSPQTYQDFGVLNRLNASATFLLNDKENVLSNVSRKQLTEWSVRARLSGDRSTRSKAFHQKWDALVGRLVQARLDVFGAMFNQLLTSTAVTDKLPGQPSDAVTPLIRSIDAYISSHRTQVTNKSDEARAAIKNLILCSLRSSLYDPVRRGEIKVDETLLAANLRQIGELQQQIAEARVLLKAFLKEFATSGTLSTFEYTNHRLAGISDYSEFKLLFEHHVKPFDVVANAGFSIYNNPDKAMNQDKLRDFMITFTLKGSSRNPLFRGDPDLATPITYSATGRYQRLMENENMLGRQPDIANFQARVEIPITAGFSIPISYTYATATETMAKSENRFNIGLHLDVDKVLSAVRLSRGQ